MACGARVAIVALAMAAVATAGRNESETRATDLLEEGYRLGNQIESPNRVYFLGVLTQTANKIGAPQEERWCRQMFQESFDVQDSWDRIALEKNALVALSFVNARAAMDLLWRVEAPVAKASGIYTEDVRANAASTIFANFFDSQMNAAPSEDSSEDRLQVAMGEIRRHATHLGKTGEYPYRAMGSIIQKLAARKRHEGTINLAFGEAIKFYSESSPKFINQDEEFLEFLQAILDKVSDPALVHVSLSELIKHLEAPFSQVHVRFQAEYLMPADDVVRFTDRNKSLLFRAVPLIRKHDPGLAKSITDKYPEFTRAGEGMTYISQGVIYGSVPPEQSAAMRTRMRQTSLLSTIQIKQQSDPREALHLAEQLSDSALKLVATSEIVPGLMRTDPAAAKAIYAANRSHLQEISDEQHRLHATVALTKAASAVNDEDDFKAFSDTAFQQGAEMYGEDYRQRPELQAYQRRGYSELKDIVTFASAHNLNWTVRHVRSIQNIELRAHLLVFAAEGMAKRDKTVAK